LATDIWSTYNGKPTFAQLTFSQQTLVNIPAATDGKVRCHNAH